MMIFWPRPNFGKVLQEVRCAKKKSKMHASERFAWGGTEV